MFPYCRQLLLHCCLLVHARRLHFNLAVARRAFLPSLLHLTQGIPDRPFSRFQATNTYNLGRGRHQIFRVRRKYFSTTSVGMRVDMRVRVVAAMFGWARVGGGLHSQAHRWNVGLEQTPCSLAWTTCYFWNRAGYRSWDHRKGAPNQLQVIYSPSIVVASFLFCWLQYVVHLLRQLLRFRLKLPS